MKKKIFPLSIQDKLDILFFDEKINLNFKKNNPIFLKNDFTNMKEELNLGSFKRSLNENEKNYFYNKIKLYEKKSLEYFQYMKIDNNKEINFYYFVFPKLINDGLFYREEDLNSNIHVNMENITFTSSNSNCLFKQFEKEGEVILSQREIIQKYSLMSYSLNIVNSFNIRVKDYIYLLWLQYFAKTFHYTSIKMRKFLFEQMMDKLKNVHFDDKNTLSILFDSINRYGDSNMNQILFLYLKNKNYITYLKLREKIKPENNFIQYSIDKDLVQYYNNFNNKDSIIDENNDNKNDNNNKNNNTNNSNINHFLNKNKNLILFDETSYCNFPNEKTGKKCNEPYNVQDKFLSNKKINYNDDYIKYKCDKCGIEQEIIVSAFYKSEIRESKEIIPGIEIDFEGEGDLKEEGGYHHVCYRLLSPYALINRKWFQDKLDLDLIEVCKEHFESYMSALFYFYLQEIPCDFLIPEKKKENELKISRNNNFSANYVPNININFELNNNHNHNNNQSSIQKRKSLKDKINQTIKEMENLEKIPENIQEEDRISKLPDFIPKDDFNDNKNNNNNGDIKKDENLKNDNNEEGQNKKEEKDINNNTDNNSKKEEEEENQLLLTKTEKQQKKKRIIKKKPQSRNLITMNSNNRTMDYYNKNNNLNSVGLNSMNEDDDLSGLAAFGGFGGLDISGDGEKKEFFEYRDNSKDVVVKREKSNKKITSINKKGINTTKKISIGNAGERTLKSQLSVKNLKITGRKDRSIDLTTTTTGKKTKDKVKDHLKDKDNDKNKERSFDFKLKKKK